MPLPRLDCAAGGELLLQQQNKQEGREMTRKEARLRGDQAKGDEKAAA